MINKPILYLVGVALAMTAGGAVAAQEVVHFKRGASSATLSGTIKGYDGKDYRVGAKAGQAISVLFEPKNKSCYFNVLPPGIG